MRKWINLVEAPISNLTWEPGDAEDKSFSKADRKLLSSEKGRMKIIKAFQKTPFDIEVFFLASNHFDGEDYDDNQGVDDWAKNVDAGIHDNFHEIPGKPGTIRVVMLGNLSPIDNKMPMTGWTLAHKIGHSLQDSLDDKVRLTGYVGDAIRAVNQAVSNISAVENFDSDFEKTGKHYPSPTFEYPAWIDEYLTMKSARSGNLKNGFEVFAELVAQYLIAGEVKMTLTRPEAQAVVQELNAAIKELLDMVVGKVLVEV